MSRPVWGRILAELSQPPFFDGVNSGKVCPYLMQEPLLDPAIVERIEQIYETFPDTTVEISTNGAALSQKVTDALLPVIARSNRKADIWISHHGIDGQMLRSVMRIDHSKALRNILYFVEQATESLSPATCQVVLRGAGHDFSNNIVYYTAESYQAYWNSLLPTASRALVKYDCFGFHDRAGTILRSERNARDLNYGVVRKIDRDHPFYCARIDEWLHFMYDGSIVLCCMDYHREVSLPNIMDLSLEEYFRSDVYQDLRKTLAGELPSSEQFICKRCPQPTPRGASRWVPSDAG